MTAHPLPARRRRQQGMTLIELMIAILLTMVICAMMLAAYIVTTRSDRQNSQDSQALAALRIANDRIAADLREARRVYQDSTGYKLHFWVDTDRDNQQDLDERITFELQTDTGAAPTSAGVPAKIVRKTDAVGSTTMLVSDDMQAFSTRPIFAYAPTFTSVAAPSSAWTDVTLVSLIMAADEAPGPYPGPRTLKTDLRLRNARTY